MLLVADGPVDAADEPAFAAAGRGECRGAARVCSLQRADLRLFSAESGRRARAERQLEGPAPVPRRHLPAAATLSLAVLLDANSWRLLFQLSVPLFDSGCAQGLRSSGRPRWTSRGHACAARPPQARSEVRTRAGAVDSAERALVSARAAADQAQQVVDIVNISFRAGGATNIEVIDAERRAATPTPPSRSPRTRSAARGSICSRRSVSSHRLVLMKSGSRIGWVIVAFLAIAVLGIATVAVRLSPPIDSAGDAVRAVLEYPARVQRVRTASDFERFAYLAASQVGYGPRMRKRFTSPSSFGSFIVIDEASGAVVFKGGAPVQTLDTDLLGEVRNRVWIGDFSPLTAIGRFHITADNGMSSHPFDVGPAVFDRAIRAVQRALYFQRAFTAIEAAHAEGPWTHPSDAARAPAGVQKGWHDAGDFSIYNAQATSSLFWLLEAYNDFKPTADNTNIPESGNGVPDLLDEARWELEWMLSVQDESGGFRNTTCLETYGPYGANPLDGGGSLPEAVRVYKHGEIGTMATARAVGTLAYASSVFAPIDRAFAERSLAAARRGWRYLEARPDEHSDGPTCPASRQDGNADLGRQVRLYASAGMLLATGDQTFQRAFSSYDGDFANDPSTFRVNVYAALVYLRARAGEPVRQQAIRQRLREHAAAMRADAAQHPFEWSGRYFWGSVNAGFERGGGFGARMCLADPVAARSACDDAAENVHYAFGRNIFQLSYVNGLPGVTRSHTHAFHHWLVTLNATPLLFPGLVAGGPNTTPEAFDVSLPNARPLRVWGYWAIRRCRAMRPHPSMPATPTTTAGPPTKSTSSGRRPRSTTCTSFSGWRRDRRPRAE